MSTTNESYKVLKIVNALPIMVDNVDTSVITTELSDVLAGKVFVDSEGNAVTGTMINNGAVNGTISTKEGTYNIPTGYHNGSGSVSIDTTEQEKIIAENIKSGVSILGVEGTFEGSSGIDTSDATATADQMLENATAYVNGVKVTGNIPTVEQVTPSIEISSTGLITASVTQETGYVEGSTKSATQQLTTQVAKTVTPTTSEQTVVASGVYTTGEVKVAAMPTAEQATPSISVDNTGLITASSTQSTGYVEGSTKSATQQLTVQAAKTVTPSTVDQTAAASNVYTTGVITVSGDANLVETNIKTGVSIFGVTGTYDGEDLSTVISNINTVIG